MKTWIYRREDELKLSMSCEYAEKDGRALRGT